MPIQLSNQELKTVKSILDHYLHNTKFCVFGSRAKGTARKYSDLDILVEGKNPIELTTLFRLKDDFSESDLVFEVDVIDRACISEEFYQAIKKDCIPI